MSGVPAVQQLVALETQTSGHCREQPIGLSCVRIVAAAVLEMLGWR